MNMNPINFYVAGVKFHKFYETVRELEEGDSVQLIPEPTNKYDKYAVRIESNSVMLGYVPRKLSISIFAKIISGATLSAKIIKLQPKFESWKALKIEVEEESHE